jgi:PIN domain nuclease of toxin-antitoxin system
MRLLLDTHVFLWYITADLRLPAPFLGAIREPTNEVYLSVASIWEAVIKHGLGKLPLPAPPAEYLPQQRQAHGVGSGLRRQTTQLKKTGSAVLRSEGRIW